jgi:hypothetical protein
MLTTYLKKLCGLLSDFATLRETFFSSRCSSKAAKQPVKTFDQLEFLRWLPSGDLFSTTFSSLPETQLSVLSQKKGRGSNQRIPESVCLKNR